MSKFSWNNDYGELYVWALFRCDCGQLAGMADQKANGNAAMVHTSPRCERFEALLDQSAALAYFRSLPQVEITPERLREVERNCHGA